MCGVFRRKRNLRGTLNNTRRLQEIVRILAKYGLTEWVHQLKLDKSFPFVKKLLTKRRNAPPEGASRWELIRMAFEELGPTFIKFGQVLSNRTDMLPRQLTVELTRLQDEVPPFPGDKAYEIVGEELAQDASTVFGEFDLQPEASASIAQVHRATLRDGTEVAVKVQRPEIRGTIETDLDILQYLAGLAEKYVPTGRLFNPTALLEEFKRSIRLELDFTVERRGMERIAGLLSHRKSVYIPKAYEDFSTSRILTMEYVRGVKISKLTEDGYPGYDREVIAKRGADVMLEQIYVHGFFHGDPHPGNIMVLPNNVVCFLDFGIIGRLRPKERDNLADALFGIVAKDAPRVTDAMIRITKHVRPIDRDGLEDEVYDIMATYVDLSFDEFDLSGLFNDLIRVVVRYGLVVPSALMLVTKSLISIEGIGASLSPDFSIMEVLEPFTRKLFMRRFRPRNVLEAGYATASDYSSFLRDFPVDARDLLKTMKRGKLRIGFHVGGLEGLRTTLDTISYRIILGLVLAALMISSALVIHAKLPPLWNDVPIIGLFGFAIAGVFSLGFLIALIVKILKR
jgi:ubiquinone biosynthesis protein